MAQRPEAPQGDDETMAAVLAAIAAAMDVEAALRPPLHSQWRRVMRPGPGQPTYWRSLGWEKSS